MGDSDRRISCLKQLKLKSIDKNLLRDGIVNLHLETYTLNNILGYLSRRIYQRSHCCICRGKSTHEVCDGCANAMKRMINGLPLATIRVKMIDVQLDEYSASYHTDLSVYGISNAGDFITVSGMNIYYAYTRRNFGDITIHGYVSKSPYLGNSKCSQCHRYIATYLFGEKLVCGECSWHVGVVIEDIYTRFQLMSWVVIEDIRNRIALNMLDFYATLYAIKYA